MNTQNNIEERLWEYIDGLSSDEEKTVIARLLETDANWKAMYGELLAVNQLLKTSELEAPSMRFTKNVMEEITRTHIAPAAKTYINKKIIWGLGIFFITMIAGFLIYGFGQMEWTTSTQNNLIADNLGKVDFSKFFNNKLVNAFMMVNLVLGLFLLDSYLTNKRKKYQGGTNK